MEPAAVILDFDGVVVDSLAAHLVAWGAAVQEIFRQPLTEPEALAGMATRTIAHILAKRFGDSSLAGPLAAAKERLVLAGAATLPVLPGAREMIAALAARRLPFGIASNSRKAFVAGALASLGLNVPVVTCGDEVRRGKPAPDLFWDCANRLGVAVHDRPRTVVFEDSPHGLKAAVAAGMLPIGVTSAVPADELLAAGAVAICMDLGDALNLGWLDQLPGQR